jgi:hypothetical protein
MQKFNLDIYMFITFDASIRYFVHRNCIEYIKISTTIKRSSPKRLYANRINEYILIVKLMTVINRLNTFPHVARKMDQIEHVGQPPWNLSLGNTKNKNIVWEFLQSKINCA